MQITSKSFADSLQQTATGVSSKSAASTSAATPAATENRFLTLLVAQMKNQDPLNPLDNAQVTSQMAQINTVQGIGQMNVSMTQMLTEFQNLQAVTLAGRGVLTAGNTMNLAAVQGGGQQAYGGFDLSAAASGVSIEIRDASGKVVRTLALGAQPVGPQTFTWDGLDDNGKAMVPGTFTFNVSATANGRAVPADTLIASTVIGVSNGANGIRLNLGSGGVVGYGDVRMVM